MSATLSPEQLDALRRIDSPTVANAIEAFKVRDRTQGYISMDIRCLFPDLPPVVGYAVTATVDSTTPGRLGDRARWFRLWEVLEAAPKPAILVFKDVGPQPRLSCHCGDVMATIATRLGAVGLITDGGVRDLDEVHRLGFQYWAAGVVVSHGNAAILDVGLPVSVGGITIDPGDLLHGDANGVVVVPREIAAQVADEARKVQERERRIVEFVKSGEFTLEGLRKLYGL
ncbi:MAG TPA: RraA family protein [Chloroflexota bacterium]